MWPTVKWFFSGTGDDHQQQHQQQQQQQQPQPPPTEAPAAPAPAVEAAQPSYDAEQMRQRRLERFGASPSSSPPASSASPKPKPQQSPSAAPKSSPMILKAPTPARTQPQAPAAATAAAVSPAAVTLEGARNPSRLLSKSVPQQKQPSKTAPKATTPPPAIAASGAQAPQKPLGPRVPGELREWESSLLQRVLEIDWRSSTLCNELKRAGDSGGLSEAVLDRAVLEALQQQKARTAPIDLVLESLARLHRERETRVGEQVRADRDVAIASLSRLLVSYAGICVMHPDALGAAGGVSPRWRLLRALGGAVEGLDAEDLLAALAERFGPSADEMRAVFEPLLTELCQRTEQSDDVTTLKWAQVLSFFACRPEVARVLSVSPLWMPPKVERGADMETKTILGLFLTRSPLPQNREKILSIAKQYFPNPSNYGAVQSSIKTYRQSLRALQNEVATILSAMLADSTTRDAALDWITAAVLSNMERRKMHYDELASASDGFMINLTAVLLDVISPLCKLDPAKSGIDTGYLLHDGTRRLDFSRFEKLAASEKEVAEWIDIRNPSRQVDWQLQNKGKKTLTVSAGGPSDGAKKPVNLMATECFYAAMLCLNLGFHRTTQKGSEIMHSYQNALSQRTALEERRPTWAGTPQAAMNDAQLSAVNANIDSMLSVISCYQTMLLDENLHSCAGCFYQFLTKWMLNIVCPGTAPMIPLPTEVPMEFASLPEFLVDDLSNFIQYTAQNSESLMQSSWLLSVMDFVTCFFCSPAYIRNPFVRANLVRTLSSLVPRADVRSGSRVDVFAGNELMQSSLILGLLDFYVDVERTGSHTQFYDKFWWRAEVQKILQYVRPLSSYRKSFAGAVASENFTRFALCAINDANFLLDDCMLKLVEIHEIETEMADIESWRSMDAERRQDKESKLASDENQVSRFMRVANSTIALLHRLATEAGSAPVLVKGDVAESLAGMLNYFLMQLAGPPAVQLKTSHPERYEFNPGQLLKEIIEIYVSLAAVPDSDNFVRQVACDSRSFDREIFNSAAAIAREHGLVLADRANELEALAKRATELHNAENVNEELLGEIPEEFLDPLVMRIMTDPVLLPNSQQIVDRSTISRHLMNDTLDPFSRTPLTIDQVQPAEELRLRIQAFVRERTAKQ